MTFRDFLAVMSVGTVAAWTAWIVVLVSIDPSRAGATAVVFFYVTFAVALFGTVATGGAALRAWRKPQELPMRHLSPSFRQATLVTGLLLVSLGLASQGFLRWWSELLAIGTLSAIELACLSAGRTETPTT
jgi:hypothetical protein